MKKVVITDFTFPNVEIEVSILHQGDVELSANRCKTVDGLKVLVKDADAIITQFAPINAEVISAMERARVIVRYGIGVDNVDLEAARSRGIPVCNVPDYCIDEVADHTLAFILATTRQVVPHCLHVRAGHWGLVRPLTEMRTLREQTVGIVGFGRIGREVAQRLGAFKCRRLVYDPVVDSSVIEQAGCQAVAWDDLLAQSDIVTLHCPSTAQTRRMINSESLARFKTGAILINLARGDLADTGALVQALQSGQLSAAALDVCDPEPIPPDHPILKLDNLILAPHIASASPKASRSLRETASRLALMALNGEPLPNVVNGV